MYFGCIYNREWFSKSKITFYDLSKKGVKGRIITSNYLGFNSPKMFEELLKLENVEVKLTNIEGFHAKGYIFEHHNHTSFIIGVRI